MAGHLSVESVIDKNKITSSVVWLILMDVMITDPNTREVVETIHVARNNENVLFKGEVYQAANFDFQINQQKGQAPTATITAQDQIGFIQQRMEEMAGGVFSEVRIYVVNSERLDADPEAEERFAIVSSSTKDGVVSFSLGAENPLAIQWPKHTQRQDRCAWRFRGYGCRYAGPATTCDYTKDGPNGCLAKGNTMNFRALPGLVRMNI